METKTTINSITEALRTQIGDNGYVDVGKGVEANFNVDWLTLSKAVSVLANEGYARVTIFVNRIDDPKRVTFINVLAHKGATESEVFKNRMMIRPAGLVAN